MFKKSVFFLLLAVSLILLGSCESMSVKRVAGDEQIDLSGRWNDTDSQMVAETMVEDLIKRPWLTDHLAKAKKKPVLIVGVVRNRSDEHIDSTVFITDIERELLNSGKVSFVASEAGREAVREERMSQQLQANPDTVKRLGRETGADFLLQGVITSVTDAIQGKRVVSYKVDLELIQIETNEKVWIGTKQIKKYVEQAGWKL